MMPRVYVKRDQTLAAVPGSEDFEAALAGGVERLRIFIKEVTLGSQAHDFH
jgi:hypothetical protein